MTLPMAASFFAVCAIFGIALGIMLGRYIWPAGRGADPALLIAAQSDLARMEQERNSLRTQLQQIVSEQKAVGEEARKAAEDVARLNERAAGLTRHTEEQTVQIGSLTSQRDAAAIDSQRGAAEVAQLKERETGLTKQVEEQGARIGALTSQRDAAAAEAKGAAAEVARLTERESGLAKQVNEQAAQIGSITSQRDIAASEAIGTAAEVARLKEREGALMQQLEAQRVQLADMQKQLTTEFENIAARILKANATELSDNSKKSLAGILDPFKERIEEFQKKVENTYAAETREVLTLREQIRAVVETSTNIGTQADGLARALRGDSQLLGRWGELALERILESAGLTEGREFISQGRGMGLKGDDGGQQKPDIVLMLPEQRTMIVDSKTPLTSYERLIAAKDENERGECADTFVRDVKGHIDDLAGKRYQENEKLQAHDCVLMFVPIEGALAAALTREPELFTYAWARNVVLVGPPTLLMTLRTIASIWRYELQGQNAQEIARLAGDLCDKVSMSLTDLGGVADKITIALGAHNDAIKRLSTGKGNVLSLGTRIRSLGVRTKRPMPTMLVDGVSAASETDEAVEQEN
jgi:DNA recombination protein RmuC